MVKSKKAKTKKGRWAVVDTMVGAGLGLVDSKGLNETVDSKRASVSTFFAAIIAPQPK